jgi:hypothetical protein
VAEVKVKRPTLLTDLEAFVPEHWDQRRLRKGGSEGPPGGKNLPGTWSQMWTIFERSSRKWLNASEVVLADVLLTALLGCILSVAQQQSGGTPQGSLLWLVITVMAFGCLALMRSLRSFGGERVIFLQRESRVSEEGHKGQDKEVCLWLPCIQQVFVISVHCTHPRTLCTMPH